tara:strand:- start:25342 stop:25554 length:213 start_codon:yes stop_codon:yes gene_type:complete
MATNKEVVFARLEVTRFYKDLTPDQQNEMRRTLNYILAGGDRMTEFMEASHMVDSIDPVQQIRNIWSLKS